MTNRPSRELLTVLVVDPEGSGFIDDLLGDAGSKDIRTVWAGGLEEGLRTLRDGDVDVCVVRHALGPGGAIELLKDEEVEASNVPVILTTDRKMPEMARRARAAGAADILGEEELTGPCLDRAIRHVAERARRRRADSRLRLHVGRSRELVSVLDEEGTLLYVSPSLTGILGFDSSEKIGAPSLLEVHPEDRDRIGRALVQALEDPDHLHRLRYRVRHADGTWRILDTLAENCLDDPGIGGIVTRSWDVTRLKETEADLRERVKELRTLYQATRLLNAPDDPIEVCLQRLVDTLPPGWLYPEITEACLTIDGTTFRTTEYRPSPWTLSAEIVSEGAVTGHLDVVLTEERPERDEGPFLEEERELLDTLAEIVGQTVARHRLTGRLEILTTEISEVIFILDPDGRVLYTTPSITGMTGYTPEEFEQMNAFDLMHPEDRSRLLTLQEELLADPASTVRGQHRIVRRTGEVRHVESVGRNLVDHPGVGGILITARDVTDRIEMDERLQESQRLESIGRLSGGIAHDFNNLLTVIRSQTDLLLMDSEVSETTASDLRVIQSAADRGANLTNQLLAFSRDQVLQPRVVDLSLVIERMSNLLDRTVGVDVRVEVETPEDRGIKVEVDPGQLEQVVLNLAVNARDAMPGGGVLTLRTFRDEVSEEQARERRDLEAGAYSVLAVSDTGVGMSEETRARAFEPFFSTKRGEGGTGLGLAMAYGFVRQSGGGIDLESTPGEGTTFYVRLPTVDDREEETGAFESSDEAAADLPVTVLVVEDDPGVSRLVAKILERVGVSVLEATDGESALELLKDGAAPEVVLTDLGLPGISGLELADRIRTLRPELPIVFMSGYAAGAWRLRRDPGGRIHFVQKPFAPPDLVQAIRKAMDEG